MQEETNVIKCKVRIHKLVYDLERYKRYITYLENNLVSREDEIERLKIDYQFIQHELDKCRDYLDLKEEALVAQDEHIIQLETTVDNLKEQILKLSRFQNHGNKKTDQQSMSLPELRDVNGSVWSGLDLVLNQSYWIISPIGPRSYRLVL